MTGPFNKNIDDDPKYKDLGIGDLRVEPGTKNRELIPETYSLFGGAMATDFANRARQWDRDVGCHEDMVVTGCSPSSADQGDILSVSFSGINFQKLLPPVVRLSGVGTTVTESAPSSSSSFNATFMIGGSATTGTQTVHVETAGQTDNTTFTIN